MCRAAGANPIHSGVAATQAVGNDALAAECAAPASNEHSTQAISTAGSFRLE
jgi:hypothetical protein